MEFYESIYYELLDSEFVYFLLHSFYEQTGLLINFSDLNGWTHKEFFPGKEGNAFCKIITSNSLQLSYCMNEPGEMGKKAALLSPKKPIVYTCHAGLIDVVMPVFVQNTHVANLVTGQFRNSNEPTSNFKKILKEFPKELKGKLKELYSSTKILSKEEIYKITNILSFMSSYITKYWESYLYDKKIKKEEKDVINKIRDYILNNYKKQDLTLKKIANEVGLNPIYLSNLFKKRIGVNITDYITNVRIRFAKRLLGNTDHSIKTICFSCGFRTFRHFCRVFKNKEKITPSEFRISYRKIYPISKRIF
jgi:AraC-like DNA-binding protein